MITGDDVLIEYVGRLIKIMREVPEVSGNKEVERSIDKFIVHYVWHSEDQTKNSYWRRLENRLNEMLTRRKKLLKNLTRKELKGTHDENNDKVLQAIIKEKEVKKSGLL